MSMISAELEPLCITALTLYLHIGVFRYGEWHLHITHISMGYAVALLASVAESKYLEGTEWTGAVSHTLSVRLFLHFMILFSSISIYRALFHGLHAFPGPRMAAVTKFWHVWHCRDSKNYLLLEKLRHRYGDYVRTGPNELTIFDPKLASLLQDTRNHHFPKSAWYDFLYPYMGLVSIRNKDLHTTRRKIWDKGFTIRAIHDYEERVMKYVRQLDEAITAANGQPFENLGRQRMHSGPSTIRQGMELLGIATPVPWLAQIAFKVPVLQIVKDWNKMMVWCRSRMEERLRSEPPSRDIFSSIIEGSVKTDSVAQDTNLLVGDAITLIIAGSDTAALTLTNICYRLARHQKEQDRLFTEIQGIDSPTDSNQLRTLTHLNAIIMETLRLHPAVPTGGLRCVSDEGLQIGDLSLPPGITICVPQYSMCRREDCFTFAEEFLPDRWTTRPDLVKQPLAFMPFGAGKYNCIGKNLAMSELRLVTALLVSKYRISFCPGQDGSQVVSEGRDNFTFAPGKLQLRFQLR